MFHTDTHLPVFRSTKAQIEGSPKTIDFIVKICFYATCLYLLYFKKLIFIVSKIQREETWKISFIDLEDWKDNQRQFCKCLTQ